MTWLCARGADVLLTLHVQPGAKKTEIVGPHGDALKIRLSAPPVDGKANDALVKFLALTLGLPRSSIAITAGHGARRKSVEITGMQLEKVSAVLTAQVA